MHRSKSSRERRLRQAALIGLVTAVFVSRLILSADVAWVVAWGVLVGTAVSVWSALGGDPSSGETAES